MIEFTFDVEVLTPNDIDWPVGVDPETIVLRDNNTGLVYFG